MKYSSHYPLINSIILSFIYLITCLDDSNQSFFILILFGPGILFPVLTSYYSLPKLEYKVIRIISHLILSILIYYLAMSIMLQGSHYGNNDDVFRSITAGFIGSLFYLLASILLLNMKLNFFLVFACSILSGLSFSVINQGVFSDGPIDTAVPFIFWTILNGAVINFQKKEIITKIGCSKCKIEIDSNTSFCTNCGWETQLEYLENPSCPLCQKTFPAGSIYCNEDGSKLF